MLMAHLPGACKCVGDVVCSDDPSKDQIEAVRQEVQQISEVSHFCKDFAVWLVLPETAPAAEPGKLGETGRFLDDVPDLINGFARLLTRTLVSR